MEDSLKPCPLCGGHARTDIMQIGRQCFNATIVCDKCGLTLDWQTEYISYETMDGSIGHLKIGLNPIDAWNRRFAKIDSHS